MDTEPRGSPVGGVVLFCREDSKSCVPSPASGRYLFLSALPPSAGSELSSLFILSLCEVSIGLASLPQPMRPGL